MQTFRTLAPGRAIIALTALAFGVAVGAAAVSAVGRPAAPAQVDSAGPAQPIALSAAVTSTELGDLSKVVAAEKQRRPDRQRQGAGLRRLLLGRTERAEVTVTTTNGTKTFLYLRGEITAVSAMSIIAKIRDGSTSTFAIDASTVIREQGKSITAADLAAGERAMIFGSKNADGTYTARLIRCVKEPKATGTN
jgi:hypothetical protein